MEVPIAVVLTDRRVLFASAEADDREAGVDAGALAYADLAAARVEDGRVELSTTDGVEWCLQLSPDGPGVADAVARHLGWIGEVRAEVVAAADEVERAAGEIGDLADEAEWAAAAETYDRARAAVDAAIQAVQRAEPIDDAVLAPEVTGLERTLEAAYADLLVERAESRLSLGQRLVERGAADRARTLVESAREDYRGARERARAVERPDEFRFGQQRSVHERLERLRWGIDAVAAEPLRRAYEAKLRALAADDAAGKVDRWERTFRRFGRVLGLLSREGDSVFTGDPAVVREELVGVAGQLLAIHRTLARVEYNEGVHRAEADAVQPAVRRLDSGIEHLERAHELAAEFRPDAAPDMAALLDRMRTARDEFVETGDAERVSATAALREGPPPDDDAQGRGLGLDRDGGPRTNGGRGELLAPRDADDADGEGSG